MKENESEKIHSGSSTLRTNMSFDFVLSDNDVKGLSFSLPGGFARITFINGSNLTLDLSTLRRINSMIEDHVAEKRRQTVGGNPRVRGMER